MFNADKLFINTMCPIYTLNYLLADEEPKVFLEQIKESDVIVLQGGLTPILYRALSKIPNIEESFKEKIIVGISAGALVLGKYYYEGDFETYSEGLGVIPKKIICHWGEARFNKLKGLEDFGEDLEILKIPEQEFVVIEKK